MRWSIPKRRRGAVLPLAAIAIVPILAILALAVDLGMYALARSQLQAAADAAALAGVRRLHGDYAAGANGGYAGVQAAAEAAANANSIVGKATLAPAEDAGPPRGALAAKIGHYRYDDALGAFAQFFPGGATPALDADTGLPLPWTLVKTELSYRAQSAFAPAAFGASGPTVKVVAAAAHRPRDVAIVLDLSGSMTFDSAPGVEFQQERFRTNNPDRAYPRFGHWAYAASRQNGLDQHDYDLHHTAATTSGTARDYNVGNLTVNPAEVDPTFNNTPALVESVSTKVGAAVVPAWPPSDFPAAANGYAPPALALPLAGAGSANVFQDRPAGDRPYLAATAAGMNLGTAYARTARELVRGGSDATRDPISVRTFGADFEIQGYGPLPRTDGSPRFAANLSASHKTAALDPDNGFAGYTQGPRYWGKTFWQWPADPRAPVTASPRVEWHAPTGRWQRVANPGTLNQWLAELDRNWLLLPNGRRASLLDAQNGVLGLSRYAAGAYDPLLRHWPVDETGAPNPWAWTRVQVERYLRGQDLADGSDLRLPGKAKFLRPKNRTGAAPNADPQNTGFRNLLGVAQYRNPPAPPAGTEWHFGAAAPEFWNGPIVNAETGAGIDAGSGSDPEWLFPRCKWDATAGNWSAVRSDGNLKLEGVPYAVAARRTSSGSGSSNEADDLWVAPSPALLAPTDPIPAAGVEWATAPTQAQLDAQIARLILALYDNAKADYDWRKRFFIPNASPAAWPDNTVLFESRTNAGVGGKTAALTGHFQRVPTNLGGATGYRIDYDAVLRWIKQTGPNPFPPNLCSGRVVYYDAIPDTIELPVPANPDQRFWKEYIDWTLGFARYYNWMTPEAYEDTHARTGYGRDFPWPDGAGADSSINPKPAAAALAGGAVRNPDDTAAALPAWPGKAPFQNYSDSPLRPKARLWFGPLTMCDFLTNQTIGAPLPGRYGTLASGAMWQAQAAACKLGVRAALQDGKLNHPNDKAALIFFSGADQTWQTPRRFGSARSGLGVEYAQMIDYLFFPPSTVRGERAEIRWNDPEMAEVPQAYGGTCYDYPMILAFNQFSGNPLLRNANAGLPAGNAGGMGRRGAQKIVVFETDGMPNTKAALPDLKGAGDRRYYQMTLADTPTLSGGALAALNFPAIVEELAKPAGAGGFSYPGKPAQVHALGYGYLFEASYTRPDTAGALQALGLMQQKGNVDDAADGATLFSHPTTGTSTIADYKIVTGDFNQRVEKMRRAFTRILQEKSVQVSLIE